LKYAKLAAVAGFLLAGGAAAGCSGGYGGPNGPDTSSVASARSAVPAQANIEQVLTLALRSH
jgi:hypothetical protein